MIDFWEIAGRLMLMGPTTRKADFYDNKTGLMPIQSSGCILVDHCNTATLPFPIPFYDAVRQYLSSKYPPKGVLLSPVISMFALGETGVMFFNQPFRDLFEALSTYLLNKSAVKGRKDTGSASLFYIALSLLVFDRTFRTKVIQGDFLGLEPSDPADKVALQTLATDPGFTKSADEMCLLGGWKPGSVSTLRNQTYETLVSEVPIAGQTLRIATKPIPFRHFRFIDGLP